MKIFKILLLSIFLFIAGALSVNAGTVVVNVTIPDYNLQISKAGSGSGTATPSPVGSSCGTGCYTYTSGSVVTLSATPSAGSTFSGWSGNVDCPDASVVMNASMSCTATFMLIPTTIDLTAASPFQSGAVIGNSLNFTSNISNVGSASTGGSFPNIFQVATASNGGGTLTIINSTPNPMPSLASGGAALATSSSYTFTGAAGTYSVRACADNNSSWTSSISESDENNNCSAWKDITVIPNQTIDLTASNRTPSAAIAGTAKTFSSIITNNGNSSTGAGFTNLFQTSASSDGSSPTSYAVTGMTTLAAGANATTSKSLTFATAGTYYVRICADNNTSMVGTISEIDEGNNCSSWSNVIVSESATIDLVAANKASTTATAGVSKIFSTNITNNGNTTTGAGFTNLFQTSASSDGSSPTNYAVTGMTTLAAGATSSTSKVITFPTAGTYYVRICADNNTSMVGTISESNEGNNCNAWFSVTVSPAVVSGTLTISPSSCVIAVGASTCTVTGATWTTTGTTSPALIDVNTGAVLSNLPNNAAALQVWVAYPQTVLNLKDGATILDTKIATASCTSGSSWSVDKCVADPVDLCPLDAGVQTVLPCASGGIAGVDLIAQTAPAPNPSGAVIVGVSTSFRSVIKNQGDTSTATSFKNLFQFSTQPNGGGTVSDRSVAVSTIGLNAGATKFTERPLVFNTVGTYYVRACADKKTSADVNGDVAEADENNNCSWWRPVDVVAAAVPVDGVWGAESYGACGGCDIDGKNGTQTVTRSCIGPFDGGAACPASPTGTVTWISSQSCNCIVGPFTAATLTASPNKIYKGKISTLTWSAQTPVCKITDDAGNVILDNISGKTGSVDVKPTKTTIYKLSCVNEEASVEVKVTILNITEN